MYRAASRGDSLAGMNDRSRYTRYRACALSLSLSFSLSLSLSLFGAGNVKKNFILYSALFNGDRMNVCNCIEAAGYVRVQQGRGSLAGLAECIATCKRSVRIKAEIIKEDNDNELISTMVRPCCSSRKTVVTQCRLTARRMSAILSCKPIAYS